jgi:hypothetical protein
VVEAPHNLQAQKVAVAVELRPRRQVQETVSDHKLDQLDHSTDRKLASTPCRQQSHHRRHKDLGMGFEHTIQHIGPIERFGLRLMRSGLRRWLP